MTWYGISRHPKPHFVGFPQIRIESTAIGFTFSRSHWTTTAWHSIYKPIKPLPCSSIDFTSDVLGSKNHDASAFMTCIWVTILFYALVYLRRVFLNVCKVWFKSFFKIVRVNLVCNFIFFLNGFKERKLWGWYICTYVILLECSSLILFE